MNNSRAILVIAFVFLFFIVLVIKLVDIQIIKSEQLRYYAERQQTALEKIDAERGLIYDRNNVLLVFNRNDISFYLDLRMASKANRVKIADRFSKVFGKSRQHYLNLMNRSKKTICIEDKAPSEKALALKNFKIPGLFYREDPTRVYHYGALASHVLGFVNTEYRGVNGIAKSFNDVLKGEDGSRLVERDAIGDMITVSEEETKPAKPGLNLVLTINKTYQNILEEELVAGLKKYGGLSAVGIIMDPNTGEILALANNDDFDPNEYWKYTNDDRRDRAITDTYEPGSTFKSVTMAALLDQNICKPNDKVFVENGRYKFKNVYITDTHRNSWLTVKGVLEHSSNVGISKLVQKIDDETYYKYLRGFGFGNYTAVDLPGEVKGTLKKPDEWSAVSKAFMSFGYEVAVTPMQLITAYSAIINGGKLYKPLIVKRETTHNGDVVNQFQPKIVRQVISKHTSDIMRDFLIGVVENGTGKNAAIDGIMVGGKTGTAQRLIDGSYSKAKYNSSFVGFFPANNPQIVCLILVNSPTVGRYGGAVAAPIFKNVSKRIIDNDFYYFHSPKKNAEFDEKDVKIALNENQKEKNETAVATVSQVQEQHQKLVHRTGKNKMPDLTDLSVKDAIYTLTRLGLKYKINGSGKIISQSIQPGSAIKNGMLCSLDCKEATIEGTVIY